MNSNNMNVKEHAPEGSRGSVCSESFAFERIVLGGKVANVMPIDGSSNLEKLLRHYRELVTELWTDLNMVKHDDMTVKTATSSLAFEQAELMVATDFKAFVITVLEDSSASSK